MCFQCQLKAYSILHASIHILLIPQTFRGCFSLGSHLNYTEPHWGLMAAHVRLTVHKVLSSSPALEELRKHHHDHSLVMFTNCRDFPCLPNARRLENCHKGKFCALFAHVHTKYVQFLLVVCGGLKISSLWFPQTAIIWWALATNIFGAPFAVSVPPSMP